MIILLLILDDQVLDGGVCAISCRTLDENHRLMDNLEVFEGLFESIFVHLDISCIIFIVSIYNLLVVFVYDVGIVLEDDGLASHADLVLAEQDILFEITQSELLQVFELKQDNGLGVVSADLAVWIRHISRSCKAIQP